MNNKRTTEIWIKCEKTRLSRVTGDLYEAVFSNKENQGSPVSVSPSRGELIRT